MSKLKVFDLQRFAITLPTNPDASVATAGKDYFLYINTGTVSVPAWTKIGGQRNSPLSQTADTIDVSHKDSGGYKSTIAGLKGWNIAPTGLYLLDNDGIEALEYAYDNSMQVNIKLERPDKKYKTGWASVTEFSLEPPHDGEATLSVSLEGVGPISEWIPSLTPVTATTSKAAATDQTFNILPTTTTISSIKNGATALTLTTHYTYSAGTLVIKGTYLGGLTVGTIPLTVTTGEGATLTITIELTA
jgi:TP901-1 family phage major tail protein